MPKACVPQTAPSNISVCKFGNVKTEDMHFKTQIGPGPCHAPGSGLKDLDARAACQDGSVAPPPPTPPQETLGCSAKLWPSPTDHSCHPPPNRYGPHTSCALAINRRWSSSSSSTLAPPVPWTTGPVSIKALNEAPHPPVRSHVRFAFPVRRAPGRCPGAGAGACVPVFRDLGPVERTPRRPLCSPPLNVRAVPWGGGGGGGGLHYTTVARKLQRFPENRKKRFFFWSSHEKLPEPGHGRHEGPESPAGVTDV